MKRGELFDYLTEKVTLSEKETRSASLLLSLFDLFTETKAMNYPDLLKTF